VTGLGVAGLSIPGLRHLRSLATLPARSGRPLTLGGILR
jgi:hypothetical protein